MRRHAKHRAGGVGRAALRLLAVSLLLAACSDRGSAPPRPREAPPERAPDETVDDTDDHTEPRPEAEAAGMPIGFARIPEAPSAQAQHANRSALRLHRSGDHEASLAGFRRALEEAPDYDAARFNAACAQARLGQLDEARATMGALLRRDLPTYASKLATDPDLQALRIDPELRALVRRLTERYRAAIPTGVEVVASRPPPASTVDDVGSPDEGPLWSQAGVLTPERRFVPLAPRLRRREPGRAILATLVDAAHDRVLALRYPGTDAEDPVLRRVRIEAYRIPTGERLWSRAGPPDLAALDLGATATGALLRTEDFRGHERIPIAYTVGPEGMRRGRGALSARAISAGPLAWRVSTTHEGYSVEAGHLQTPDARIELGPGHRAMTHRRIRVDAERELAVVVSARWGDCGVADRYVIDVVDLARAATVRHVEGAGQVHVELGPDGALYVQSRDAFRRYADPREEASETLPDGLGLSSQPWDFNPYC